MHRYLRLAGQFSCAVAFAIAMLALPVMAQTASILPEGTPLAIAPEAQPASPPESVATLAPITSAHPWINVAEPKADSSDDDDWKGSIAIYGFLSSFDGELRAGDRAVDVDSGFGDITDILKFAVGFRVEAQNDRWGFAFDNNYVHIGDDVMTDRLVTPDFRYDVAMNVTEIEPSYRLYKSGSQEDPVGGPKVALDVIGGVRIVHLTSDIEIRRVLGDDSVRDQSGTYVHGYVGGKLVLSPWKYLTLEGRTNVSLASDLSWYIGGHAYIQPWEHVSFGVGLQALDLSLENDSKNVALDARFFGPIVALRFHF